MFVIGAKNDGITREISAGSHLTTGVKGPTFFARGGLNAVKNAVDVADKDLVAEDTGATFDWTRLVRPLRLSGNEVDSIKISVHRADINGSIRNYGRSLDRVFGFEFPADDKLV